MCGSWQDPLSCFIDLSCSCLMFISSLVHCPSSVFSVDHLGAVPVYDVVERDPHVVFCCRGFQGASYRPQHHAVIKGCMLMNLHNILELQSVRECWGISKCCKVVTPSVCKRSVICQTVSVVTCRHLPFSS